MKQPPRKPAFVNITFDDDGATFELNYLPEGEKIPVALVEAGRLGELATETEMFYIPNKWMGTVMSAMRGRLGYLADTGKFRPGP